jgi:predicted  nucleic acid-binding Zn-ribbon protein
MLSKSLSLWEGEQSRYESELARYRTNLQNYQQELKKYEQEMPAYQARLPEYQANVDAEIRSIKNSINPNAPEDWIGYIEGKYLIYKGKAE